MSGSHSLPILQKIFQPQDSSCPYLSHQMYYGRIIDPEKKSILDEVLAVFMQGPRTYTREDVVEVHCHGNFLVLQTILACILKFGACLADPGEFTKRAYLNGRIDLTRAEAVIDLLTAKTGKGVEIAQEQLAGRLFHQVDLIRKVLVEMRALVEVAIDFPDEDIEIIRHSELLARLKEEVIKPLQVLIGNAEHGRIFREGISVVIAGMPNVGKSSLLNSLVQDDRALVTAIPGTTRDTIEEHIDIMGMPVQIIDTAGLREGAEEVEALGIKRAKAQIDKADLVLFMIDISREITDSDRSLYAPLVDKPHIVVLNKIDRVDQLPDLSDLCDANCTVVEISAKFQKNISVLKEAIFNQVVSESSNWQEDACVPNMRHRQALLRAFEAGEQIKGGLETGLTSDLLAIDLQECVDQLDDIVGITTTDDVLDFIFEQFCLGK